MLCSFAGYIILFYFNFIYCDVFFFILFNVISCCFISVDWIPFLYFYFI